MSRAFGFVVKTRERLYQRGVFRTHKLDRPVISVGNLTLGGTGKTPLVIALASRLRDEGWSPVILSRGYKRTTAGVVLVSRGDGPVVKWREAGDEPFLIARRVHGAAVVVGSDRFLAGQFAERETLGNIFILDDGFQHRQLFREVDLVAVDPVEWNAGEHLLPLGRWRETKAAIARGHAACVLDASESARSETALTGSSIPCLPIPSFKVQTMIEGLYQGSQPVSLETLSGRSLVAFAGIAKPERFFSTLRATGLQPSRCAAFRDHHAYTKHEIEALGGDFKITTEKDAVRLDGTVIEGLLHVRVSAIIPEFDRLMELIRGRLAACRN